MNSFIGWIGGKKLLRKEIIKRFPKQSEIERYIEVFGGAGWVLFGKDEGNHLEVFNDLDGNLINLYRCLKYHCNALQEELAWLLLSREQFFKYKKELESGGLTDIQRAARYFYLIKHSFGADRITFGINQKNIINAAEYLTTVRDRLKKVVIENRDFEELLKVYDRKNALIYLDPPYLHAEKYYAGDFNMQDHERLRGVLDKIKGKFILSYNDHPVIREMYKGYVIDEVSRNSNLTNKVEPRTYKELIIQNY